MPAGYSVSLHLTVRQEQYYRRAIGITHFIYNLCVATHRLCRMNRLPWPSWQDMYKVFNGYKYEDYPFVTEVASRVQEGAFMDFGAAFRNWRDPSHPGGAALFQEETQDGSGFIPSGIWSHAAQV